MFCLRVVLRRLPNNVGKLLTTIGKLLCENSAILGPTFQKEPVSMLFSGWELYGHINHFRAVCTKKQK